MATKIISFPGGAVGPVYDTDHFFDIGGSWVFVENLGGRSKIYNDNGAALAGILQGVIKEPVNNNLQQNPPDFGGLTPDNTANGYNFIISGEYSITTTMPNSNAPVCTHVWNQDLQFMWRVLRVEDDDNIWLDDPWNYAASAFGGGARSITGTSVNLSGMTNVVITSDGELGITLASQAPVNIPIGCTITLNANNEGVVEPFMIFSNGNNITVTITQ